MEFITRDNEMQIILDEREDEREVLRAIVKASFELAEPAGLSVLDYRPEHELTDSEADCLIWLEPRSYDSCIVDMEFVKGRQCRTILLKDSDRRFVLYSRYFERFRGTPAPVLSRAADILSARRASETQTALRAYSCA